MSDKKSVVLEEKIRMVKCDLSGEIGVNEAARQLGVHGQTFNNWVQLYRMRGLKGLCPANGNRKYSPELKCQAVREYLSGAGSLREICEKYDISSDGMLRKWIRVYNDHKDFKQPNSGGAICMVKGRKTTLEERIEIVSYCISNNKDYGKTIDTYGMSYQQIYGWVRKYEKDGVDGLADRRGKHRDEASMSEIERLRAQLKLKEAENLWLQMENELLKNWRRSKGGETRIKFGAP